METSESPAMTGVVRGDAAPSGRPASNDSAWQPGSVAAEASSSTSSSDEADEPNRGGWRWWHLIAGLVLVLLGGLVHWRGWEDLAFLAWNDAESSHVLLVPIIVGYLVWMRWHRVRDEGPRFSLIGPALALLALGVWEWGFRNDVRVTGHVAAILMLIGCIVTVTGHVVLWRLLPAFVTLLFAIPVPYRVRIEFTIPLQNITARIAADLMTTLGWVVERAGSVLIVNGHEVGVAEACNGMRMVFAVVLVSFAFAFSHPLRRWAQVFVLVVSPITALVCNVLRLIPTALAYGYWPTDIADKIHDLTGWAMAILAFVLLKGLAGLGRWLDLPIERPEADADLRSPWRGRPPDPGTRADSGTGAESESGGAGGDGSGNQVFGRRRGWLAAGLLTLLAIALTGAANQTHLYPDDAADYHQRVQSAIYGVPYIIGDYVGQDVPVPQAATELLMPNAVLSRIYRDTRTGATVNLLIVHCLDARDVLGHHPPVCYPNQGWLITGRGEGTFEEPMAGRYAFFQMRRGVGTDQRRVTVRQLLVLPDGRVSPDMDEASRIANNYGMRHFGAGQIQMLWPGRRSGEEMDPVWELFLSELEPVLEAVASTGGARD